MLMIWKILISIWWRKIIKYNKYVYTCPKTIVAKQDIKMLVFIKKVFYIGSLFLSSLVSTTSLNCISIKNQECKVRPERTNETRHIKWHETCKCKCRLDASACNNKQGWNNDKCWCEYKELIDKGICDNEYIWNRSNCKCECDKSCDFDEYLDYENCKCRKRLVDKLIEECNENIKETSLIKINSTKCKHISCMLYIVLFSIIFTINIGIATYFVYYKYIDRNKENVSVYDYIY